MSRARAHRSLLAASAALALAGAANASDLIFGFGLHTVYDDNVYGTTTGERDDFTLQVVPKIRFIDRIGELTADVRYDPTYEYFVDEEPLRGWNHSARAAFEWAPAPDTTVELSDDFWRYKSPRLLTGTDAGGTPVERGGREEFTRNLAQLTAQHMLTETGRLSASLYHVLWKFDERNRADQQNYGVALEYLHTLRPELMLGGSFSFSRTDFDEVQSQRGVDTNYYNGSLVLEWEPMDRFTVRLSAGPAWADEKPQPLEPPPGAILIAPVPEVESGNSVTVFADGEIEWELDRGRLSFSYLRRDDYGSGATFNSITDTVAARGSYEFLRRLSGDVALIWEGRKNDTEFVLFQPVLPPFYAPVLVSGKQRVDSFSARASLTYLIRENTKLSAWTAWRSQDDDSEIPSGYSDVDRFQFVLGVTHQFAAIRF
jgi:hypothetical protein